MLAFHKELHFGEDLHQAVYTGYITYGYLFNQESFHWNLFEAVIMSGWVF